jgi:hypothetical protein
VDEMGKRGRSRGIGIDPSGSNMTRVPIVVVLDGA